MLQRYLSFFHGAPTQVFSVANVRRKKYGADKPNEWFSADNQEGEAQRHVARLEALNDMKEFLRAGMERGYPPPSRRPHLLCGVQQ